MNVEMSAILANIVKMMIKEKSLSKKYFCTKKTFLKMLQLRIDSGNTSTTEFRLKTSMKS